MRVIGLALVMMAAPAAAADQFDLVCKTKSGESRYRVDLTRNEACEGPCDRVWKMGEPSSGQLKLIERVPAYAGDLEERATVNRSTGAYSYLLRVNGRYDDDDGQCSIADFSGFPTAKF